MCRDSFKLTPRILLGLVVILSFSGCSSISEPAVVLEKERIAATVWAAEID